MNPRQSWSGLNEATLEWLHDESAQSKAAISLATYLVEQHQWALLRSVEPYPKAALLMGSTKEGIIILPARSLTPQSVQSDIDWWLGQSTALPKNWTSVTLIYAPDHEYTEEESKSLIRSAKKSLLSRKVSSRLLPDSGQSGKGKVSRTVKDAFLNRTSAGLTRLHTVLRLQEKEMVGFFDKLEQTRSWGTYVIMSVCVLVFALVTLAGGSEQNLILIKFGANYPPLTVDARQWWRSIGSSFLHIGWLHLLVNMYSLYAVGPTLEKFLGNFRYLTLYGLCAVAGSLASAHFGGGHISAGASGAIFGIFGACAAVGYRHQTSIPSSIRKNLTRGMMPAIAFNLFYGFSTTGIDNSAHLGGLLAGLVLIWIVPPKIAQQNLTGLAKLFFLSMALVYFLVEAFVLIQAYGGYHLQSLPARTVSVDGWTVKVPNLFKKAPEGPFYNGPGVNLLLAPLKSQGDPTKTLEPKEFSAQLSKELGVEMSYLHTIEEDNSSWYLYTSDSQIHGLYALSSKGTQLIFLGVFTSPDMKSEAQQILQELLPGVRRADRAS